MCFFCSELASGLSCECDPTVVACACGIEYSLPGDLRRWLRPLACASGASGCVVPRPARWTCCWTTYQGASSRNV